VLSEDVFETEGRTVAYRRAHLTKESARLDGLEGAEVRIEEKPAAVPRQRKSVKRRSAPAPVEAASPAGTPDRDVVARLKAWRLGVARAEEIPAFRILTDKALRLIATDLPATPQALLRLSGIGQRFVDRWGREVLAVVNSDG